MHLILEPGSPNKSVTNSIDNISKYAVFMLGEMEGSENNDHSLIQNNHLSNNRRDTIIIHNAYGAVLFVNNSIGDAAGYEHT